MRKIHLALLLPLLLVFAQLGGVLHELSHYHRLSSVQTWTETDQNADKTCELCLAFSQVANPASPSLHIPASASAAIFAAAEPIFTILAADVPTPRSRGPPAFL